MFPTCVPAPGWTGSPLRWTASAALWPKRWIHSYSGTTGSASHSHEGPSGSLSAYLRVTKEAQEKQGVSEEERYRKQEHGREKKKGQVASETLKSPDCFFSLLSIAFIFLAPFITPYSYIHSPKKPWKCYLCHHALLSLWQVTVGWTVVLCHKFWWDNEQFGLLKRSIKSL